MSQRMETKKYNITVEGETEKWYFERLNVLINEYESRKYNALIKPVVCPNPRKYFKKIDATSTPELIHVCDVEGKEFEYQKKFHTVLEEMRNAFEMKRIKYYLGYSNYTFELWMVLHKQACNGCKSDRKSYLKDINKSYKCSFENLDEYKEKDNFVKCLNSLSLQDVLSAVERAETIQHNNASNGNKLIKYKTYEYYEENPALSVHEIVKRILLGCGVNKKI